MNHESGKKTKFKVFVGTEGEFRGIPIRLEHQPNWWFKVELDLEIPPNEPEA